MTDLPSTAASPTPPKTDATDVALDMASMLDTMAMVSVNKALSALEDRLIKPAINVTIGTTTPVTMPTGTTHKMFTEIVKLTSTRLPVLMTGPAGCGKTTLAGQVATALKQRFMFISLSQGITETHLFGRLLPQADGSWKYIKSPFVDAYCNGGLFLFDEIWACDPNVMISINAAMANGHLSNPVTGEHLKRHPDCYLMGADNTFGYGCDRSYVGRNQQDQATLDRFVVTTVELDYDTALERSLLHLLVGEPKTSTMMAWATTVRAGIKTNKLRRVCSTRMLVNAASIMKTCGDSFGFDNYIKPAFFKTWTPDEMAKVGA